MWVELLGGEGVRGARARVILVLRECIWNPAAVSLAVPGSLGSPRQMVYPPG